jgi:hypothetical protein
MQPFVQLTNQENDMTRNNLLATLGMILLLGGATSSAAQVKRVQMHIAGYLCGN